MAGSLLLIYTGGTIGMKENPLTGALAPFNFEQIEREVPELHKFAGSIETFSLLPLLDSSDVSLDFWQRLGAVIEENYAAYDGFVVLHGTDTMAYTASALSFMLPNLSKPVVLTGSQLPIGAIRTDGKENLLGAIEIALARRGGAAHVPEVSIFFNHKLLRGNRSTKFGASRFDAFRSFNYPALARAGIEIEYADDLIRPASEAPFEVLSGFDARVASLRLYPGLSPELVSRVLGMPDLRGLVLETYGAGNAPSAPWFVAAVGRAVASGVVVVNITQCSADSVSMESYDVGLGLARAGVVSGDDMTYESAMVKLMHGLYYFDGREAVESYVKRDISGEKRVVSLSGQE